MNYESVLYQVIESLKTDTTLPPQYRNALVSSGRRYMCEIAGAFHLAHVARQNGPFGSGTGLLSNPAQNAAEGAFPQAVAPQNGPCVCPAGARRRDCVVHGIPV